jgi:predicted AlkP superfamily phosphohydrolase/phosphomutase
MVQARTEAALHVMRMAPWDVTMVVYVAPDRMQHVYWGEGQPSAVNATWRPVRELYELLDSQLAELIAEAGDDATIIVLSDHGFGPARPWRVPTELLLARLGLLHHRTRPISPWTRLQRSLLRTARRILPPALKYRLSTAFPRGHAAAVAGEAFPHMDWARTKVFPVGFGSRLMVNLQGRQAQGCVAPEEYDSLCEEVRLAFLALSDATTGEPVVRRVLRREQLYRGPFADRAADLTVKWDHDVLRDEVQYGVSGASGAATIQNQRPVGQWNAWHRAEGIFIAHGPQVRAGAALPAVTQYDIAPTVYYLQGHSIPYDLDGRVLTELFDPELLQRHPTKHVAPAPATGPQQAPELGERDAREIEERLRGLGYLSTNATHE